MDFRFASVKTLGVASTRGRAPQDQVLTADLKCNACGRHAPDAKLLPPFSFNRKGKNISAPWFRCGVCGSFFCGMDATEQDEMAHHQTRRHGRLACFQQYRELKRPMYKYICSGMVKRGLSRGNLLDVGASFGGFLDEAKASGFQASAVDLNPDCVEYLRSKGFSACRASSLAHLPLQTSGFDAITMLDVPYYFKDQPAEFQYARELLRPGGWLVLRTTNKRWTVRMAAILAKISPKRAQRLFRRSVVDHSFVQSAGSLKTVLQDCGFREIVIEPDSTHMNQDVHWDAKATYFLGTTLSKLVGRPLLVPGVIAWARRP